MRLALAIGVIAITLAAAVYVHQRHVTGVYTACIPNHPSSTVYRCHYTTGITAKVHPSWEDPVAVLLALGGIAVAAGALKPEGRTRAQWGRKAR